jgi:hypothetical protein
VRAARRLRRQRRRRFLRWGAATAIGTVAFAFIVSLFIGGLPLEGLFSGGAPDGPGLRMVDLGAEHVLPEQEHADYNSVPATSGPHFGQPLAPARWGIHDTVLADEVLVHNLEHGYVNVHYNCPDDGCPELVQQLTELVDKATERGGKLLMSPYPDMDARIALTAWTFIDKFDLFDEDRIDDFVNSHEGSPNAPEASVPR